MIKSPIFFQDYIAYCDLTFFNKTSFEVTYFYLFLLMFVSTIIEGLLLLTID